MVAALIVMSVSAVVRSVSGVPNIRQFRHGLGPFAVQLVEEVGVDRAAVLVHPVAVKVKGFRQKGFVACHDVGEVAEGLGGMPFRSDVNVNTAPSGSIALGTCLAENADDLLQLGNVIVGKDGCDHLAFFIVKTVDAELTSFWNFHSRPWASHALQVL